MNCPKCGASYTQILTKYLQPIQVPWYAQFQPMEKLSVCLVCGYYGKHPLEMLSKEISINSLTCWDSKELKFYNIKRK